MNKQVELQDLGQKDYKETWDFQENLFQSILDTKIKNRRQGTNFQTKNYFLFVEHPHVYTLGKSGDMSNLLLDEFIEKQVEIAKEKIGIPEDKAREYAKKTLPNLSRWKKK